MPELKRYKYIIVKVVHNKKVVKLLVQQKKYPYRTYFEWREVNPQPRILHRNPQWLMDFVDKLNKKEIKFLS